MKRVCSLDTIKANNKCDEAGEKFNEQTLVNQSQTTCDYKYLRSTDILTLKLSLIILTYHEAPSPVRCFPADLKLERGLTMTL